MLSESEFQDFQKLFKNAKYSLPLVKVAVAQQHYFLIDIVYMADY